MKKILLISNHVYHYRIPIYNYFQENFRKHDMNFAVLTNSVQKTSQNINFDLYTLKSSTHQYINFIREYKPDVVISFLHLSDIIIFPLAYYCKMSNIPFVYWGHGINLQTPGNVFKRLLFRHFHWISDAILLYTPNEKKYIAHRNHYKIFVANNTLNLFDMPNQSKVSDLEYVRDKYLIKEKNIVLFVGRIDRRKRLEILLRLFRNSTDIALVVVGPGLTSVHKSIIDSVQNYYYLGAIYDLYETCRLFNASKFFCIPGNIGLALNQAFFCGVPVITMSGPNTPEIYYLKNNQNGYIVDEPEEIESRVVSTIGDDTLYRQMSENARQTSNNQAHINQMFQGFYKVVTYLESAEEVQLKKVS